MNTTDVISGHYREGLAGIQSGLAGHRIAWLEQQRTSAMDALQALPFPERRMEAWRYTGVDKMLQHCFKPVADSVPPLQPVDVEQLQLQGLETHRLVFVNGRFTAALSSLDGLPREVIVDSLHHALKQHPDRVASWLGIAARSDRDVFVAMNSAEMNDGLFVCIPDALVLERPIEVLYLTTGLEDASVVQPRNLVVLGRGAQATLIERYGSADESLYFNNGLSELILEPTAELLHFRLQQEGINGYHLHSNFVLQGADSRYSSTSFALGAGWSRSETDVRFTAEGGRTSLAGLFTVGDRQLNDVHINIDHAVPGCESQSDFRGLLHGEGRGVFDGRIVVGAEAQHTEAHLNNANLLLTRNAEMDTKPQLEIYADNVKCSHGTSVGQLEESQLFYLRSRGIGAVQAQRMLCLGFAGEILQRCEISPLREVVETALTAMLDGIDPVQQSQKD